MALRRTAQTSPETDPAAADEQTAGRELIASNENTVLPGAITRRLMAAVAWVERKNLQFLVLPSETFVDAARFPAHFPWIFDLEENWSAIRGEIARLMMRRDSAFRDGADDPATVARDRGWKTFPLQSYGFPAQQAIAQCPESWRLLQKVPGLVSAMFSVLEPGRHLPPHQGPYNGLLRLHLGLIVPEPSDDIGIRVGDEFRHWEEGRVLILDDTFEHEAWNHTEHTRVILFADFVRPLRFPARLLNWLVLNIFVFRPFIREGLDRAQWWERRFYRQAQAMRIFTSRDAA